MPFIEMSGQTLLQLVSEAGEGNPDPEELAKVGVTPKSIVRVNKHGDIELRRRDRWDVIGGFLSDFEERIKRETGLDWV